jgi:hypothetical protein
MLRGNVVLIPADSKGYHFEPVAYFQRNCEAILKKVLHHNRPWHSQQVLLRQTRHLGREFELGVGDVLGAHRRSQQTRSPADGEL